MVSIQTMIAALLQCERSSRQPIVSGTDIVGVYPEEMMGVLSRNVSNDVLVFVVRRGGT